MISLSSIKPMPCLAPGSVAVVVETGDQNPGAPSGEVTIADVTGLQAALDGKVATNDPRLNDARTPTAHKSTHATGGADAIAPSDIGAATTAQGALADTAVQPNTSATLTQVIAGNVKISGSRIELVDQGGPLMHIVGKGGSTLLFDTGIIYSLHDFNVFEKVLTARDLIGTRSLRATPTTLASLPTPATVGDGAFANITDGNNATIGGVATGSGSRKQTLRSDGTDWLVLFTT